MAGGLRIAVLYEPSDNTGTPEIASERVRHRGRRRPGRGGRWRGPERRQKIDREHVADALRANGYEAFLYELRDESSLLGLAKSNADLILNVVEAYAGEDSREPHVAAFLDLLELRYTGAGPQALFLAQDKPLSEDGSVGIDVGAMVRGLRELMERVSMIQEKFDCPALIEEFIEGREIYVGVMGNDKPVALPEVELDLSKLPEEMPKIAGREVKWDKGTAYEVTRAMAAKDLEGELAGRLQEIALEVYSALKLRDYGRVDMRLTRGWTDLRDRGDPNPWLAPEAELAVAARLAGRSYVELIGQIVELALARYAT